MRLFRGIAAEGSVDRPSRYRKQHGRADRPHSRMINLLLHDRSLRDTDLGAEDEAGDWLENAVAEIDRGAFGKIH